MNFQPERLIVTFYVSIFRNIVKPSYFIIVRIINTFSRSFGVSIKIIILCLNSILFYISSIVYTIYNWIWLNSINTRICPIKNNPISIYNTILSTNTNTIYLSYFKGCSSESLFSTSSYFPNSVIPNTHKLDLIAFILWMKEQPLIKIIPPSVSTTSLNS